MNRQVISPVSMVVGADVFSAVYGQMGTLSLPTFAYEFDGRDLRVPAGKTGPARAAYKGSDRIFVGRLYEDGVCVWYDPRVGPPDAADFRNQSANVADWN
jgi:hypothetical protein